MLSDVNLTVNGREFCSIDENRLLPHVGAESPSLPFILRLIEDCLTPSACHVGALTDYLDMMAPSLGRQFITDLISLLEGDDPARHMFFEQDEDEGVLQLHARVTDTQPTT